MKQKKWLIGLVFLVLIVIVIVSFLKPKQDITFTEEEYKKFTSTASQEEIFEVINKNMVTGGPPKDGIPSIDGGKYITAAEADKMLSPSDTVFGIDYNGFIRAYPQNIMYWHEIVNEEVDGEKIAVTYCPLTGTVIGFKGKELGVSGKLYNSNLVMYDRATDADVPQILQTAVNGPNVGEEFTNIHVYVTSWKQWKAKYPETLVLSEDTGFSRDYTRNPYPGYDELLRVWFPVAAESDQFSSKEIVTGFTLDGMHLAVHKDTLKQKGNLVARSGDILLIIAYDHELDVIKVYKDDSSDEANRIPSFDAYWFAWYAYHPDTVVL